jgi:uncharacterized protein (DUF427 family)
VIRVSLDGELLAESTRAFGLFESNLPARWYMPIEDVVATLVPSDKTTVCPYKGKASYYSVQLDDGTVVDDLVWYYPEPLMDASRIKGLVCFFNERVDLSLDGELAERPESPWSHGVKASQNAPVAQTRG